MVENMSDVYVPGPADGFERCHPVDLGGLKVIDSLIDGKDRLASWRPIAVQILEKDVSGPLEPSDSPWFGSHALIFRPSVLDVMWPALHRYGEFLPLSCPRARLIVFNPTRVVDALDEAASVVQRSRDGRIWGVSKYALRAREIVGIDVFKMTSMPVSPTFVTGRIVDLWQRAGLRGLEFRKVWSPR